MISGAMQVQGFGFNTVFQSGRRDQQNQLAPESNSAPSVEQRSPVSTQISAEQQRQIDALTAIDRKVKAHEEAHLSVGADLVRGGPTYSYQTGPDGKRYAIAGEVQIDTSKGRKPQETIPKAQHIRATALAPANPSSQDRQVAALAAGMEMEARQELALQMRQRGSVTEHAIAAYRAVDGEAQSIGLRVYA